LDSADVGKIQRLAVFIGHAGRDHETRQFKRVDDLLTDALCGLGLLGLCLIGVVVWHRRPPASMFSRISCDRGKL